MRDGEAKKCPVCRSLVGIRYLIAGNESEVYWYHCQCGTLFNVEDVNPLDVFNSEYRDEYRKKFGEFNKRADYFIRVYGQFIEEMTLGRTFLDVGHCVQDLSEMLHVRGWGGVGIDLIPDDRMIAGDITGDFETFNFEDTKFDFINMGRVLQCFKDPVAALEKAAGLLNNSGVLFIQHPRVEIIHEPNGIQEFGYLDARENRAIMSGRMIERVLDPHLCRVMMHENIMDRFIGGNDAHWIFQKREKK